VIVLGIESTAHTFGVGIVTDERENFILADVRVKYVPERGGIHPREASRLFAERGPEAVARALREAGVGIRDIDAIAVALGPGMGPCLRVGATIARMLASYYSKPLVPVNHAVAHIEIGLKITGAQDPVVVYLSGGNTAVLAFVKGRYRVFGETLDIALGNLLDTFAREVGLGPPYVVEGMHVVDRCAATGRDFVDLPYVVRGQDVAFSGLLTAAIRAYRRLAPRGKGGDVCLSFREVAYGSILEIAARCLAQTGKREVLLVGGVAASPILRDKLRAFSEFYGVKMHVVPPKYAVDNGVMIAWTGLLAFRCGITIPVEDAVVRQRWRVDEVEVVWRSRGC